MSAQVNTQVFRSPVNHEAENLSEQRIHARFEILDESKKRLFERLETEFEKRPIDSVSDILTWNDHLTKTLVEPDLADLFTKWLSFRGPKPKNRLETIDYGEFRRDLETANWKYANEAYDRVFHLMWNTGREDRCSVTLVTMRLAEAYLGVEVNPRCIKPPDPLCDSLEDYDVIGSNLTNILALRYQTEHGIEEMIIAPFGHLVYGQGKLLPTRWTRSEYALVLEIRDDGTAGEFYFVYNDTDTDEPAFGCRDLKDDPLTTEFGEGAINIRPFLCGQGPFTVAKVKGSPGMPGLKFLGCRDLVFRKWMIQCQEKKKTYPRPYDFDADDTIELDFLSTSRPEIVMTGIREGWKKKRKIVGLFE